MTPNKGRTLMHKRLKTIGGAVAALAVLALGGSAIASATRHTPRNSKKHAISMSVAAEKTSAIDTDNVQSGDQTSPDTHSAKASSASTSETPDTGSATENSSETPDTGSATENSSESDGPGGHEDPAGNVDHQSEGQE
jgi:cytoskeletal protein RodZ